METIFNIMLTIHIASGFTGLTAGGFAMLLSKTGKSHKIMGNVFFYAMAGVFISSIYMSLAKSNWFLFCVGIFSFYLAASGKRMLALKSPVAFKNGPGLPDHLLGIGGILAGLGMWVLAILLWMRGNTFGIVPAVFGSISVAMAGKAYRMFRKPPTKKGAWAIAHGARMGGAYTAMVTAFVVVNIQIEQQWLLWLLPTAIIPPVFSYQIKRFLTPIKKPFVAAAMATLFLAQVTFAQPNHVSISVQGYGENLMAKVITEFPEEGFQVQTRILPGMNKPLLYTDSTQRIGNQVSGKIYLLGGQPFRFQGYATTDSLMLVLFRNNNQQPSGIILAGNSQRPMADIQEACKQIKDTFRTYIYNKKELEKANAKDFLNKLDLYGSFLQDEWELFATINRDMRGLSFSHTRFTKINERDFDKMVNESFTTANADASLSFPLKNTAVLTINQFNGQGENLSAFIKNVISEKVENLIIDLRNNPGGGAGATLQLVKHLTPKEDIPGVLLTNKWFDTSSRYPLPNDFSNFYYFSNGTTTELIDALSQHAGVVLSVAPAKEQYTGKIFVLTSGKTASACEPVVYALKRNGRATIVGEKTAGKMLSAGAYYLKSGFLLSLPVADYYTADGIRLEGTGVAPDRAMAAENALDEVLQQLNNHKHPHF